MLCPVTALHMYISKFPAQRHAPLFLHPTTKLAITQVNIRAALAKILSSLQLPHNYITFHAFRRSGATFAFNHHVSLQNIQSHGGWKSSAVWTYLQNTQSTQALISAFQTIS